MTAGALTRLWRESRASGALPDETAIHESLERTGWRYLEVDDRRRAARLLRHGVLLDFGGIAKGYAAQQGVGLLTALGFPSCMVALAGDISVGDAPPGEAGWEIEVRHERGRALGVLTLSNRAVSTSGDSEQQVEIGGERISHMLDPRIGFRSSDGVSATVVAPTGELADAYATACCILGVIDSLDLAERDPQLGIILSCPDDQGRGERTIRHANVPPGVFIMR